MEKHFKITIAEDQSSFQVKESGKGLVENKIISVIRYIKLFHMCECMCVFLQPANYRRGMTNMGDRNKCC